MTFTSGVKAGTSIAIGYFPIAITFGLLAKTTGLSMIEATAMSLLVFAGAAQYISLSLLAKSVDPTLIILNTFIVNIRHFLMTASLNEKMEPAARWKKGLYAFGVTDETFSVLATRKESKLPTAFAAGVILISYSSWVVFTAVGHVIGDILPAFLQAAMGIALYAMFIGLLVPSMKENRKVIWLAFTGAVIHMFLYFTGLLSTGWSILVATLLSAIIVEIWYINLAKKEATNG
ncbi:AzlC family ABC transporter permease [Paenisporosarcina cavernae]|uniref:Branched-chain amino acid ABC transporter permease n=1 Tax=Paenisporosarcina cavernae TaxID=2320858 RepID=A0A385YR74_9BACL|nr:AzlC family ABC transporter permease [Paenisporosarcina cavernae]AYC28991.1 branched-chain amino acid ABC transporter permease [Paenisporosarcina cavernae]